MKRIEVRRQNSEVRIKKRNGIASDRRERGNPLPFEIASPAFAGAGLFHSLAMTKYDIRYTTYDIRENGAEGRSRTDTSCEARWILSPVRLPISPLRHMRISV